MTAVYKYSKYDAYILNISPYQARKIKNYDFVEKFVPYGVISGVKLVNDSNNSTAGVRIFALNSNDYEDINFTPYCPRLIKNSNFSLLEDSEINPIYLIESIADELNATVGDKIIADFYDMTIEYTLVAIYDDAIQVATTECYVFIEDSLADWLLEGFRKVTPTLKREDIGLSHGYITFNDKVKGREFLNNFYSDTTLYEKYGEEWINKAEDYELENYKGQYYLREVDHKRVLHNMTYDYPRIMALIIFGCITLILFIIWERNKIITLSIQSISILVATGCRKLGFFLYFLITTFIKNIIYLALSLIIFKFFIINRISGSFHVSWYLMAENIPIILLVALISSLIVSITLYIKLKSKIVLFTGEE